MTRFRDDFFPLSSKYRFSFLFSPCPRSYTRLYYRCKPKGHLLCDRIEKIRCVITFVDVSRAHWCGIPNRIVTEFNELSFPPDCIVSDVRKARVTVSAVGEVFVSIMSWRVLRKEWNIT